MLCEIIHVQLLLLLLLCLTPHKDSFFIFSEHQCCNSVTWQKPPTFTYFAASQFWVNVCVRCQTVSSSKSTRRESITHIFLLLCAVKTFERVEFCVYAIYLSVLKTISGVTFFLSVSCENSAKHANAISIGFRVNRQTSLWSDDNSVNKSYNWKLISTYEEFKTKEDCNNNDNDDHDDDTINSRSRSSSTSTRSITTH